MDHLADIMALGSSRACFPLTLTFSLREREQVSVRWENSSGVRFVLTSATILPLPKGEGRGEGEQDFLTHYAGDFALRHTFHS